MIGFYFPNITTDTNTKKLDKDYHQNIIVTQWEFFDGWISKPRVENFVVFLIISTLLIASIHYIKHIYVCVYVYIGIYVYKFRYAYVCLLHTCMCINVSMHVCIYIHAYIFNYY